MFWYVDWSNIFPFTVDYLADLYCEAQKTYTIQDDDKITTVMVERQEFQLTEAARQAFEAIHDQWELTVCQKYPHDPFIGGKPQYFSLHWKQQINNNTNCWRQTNRFLQSYQIRHVILIGCQVF